MDYGEVRVGVALTDFMKISIKPYKILLNNQDLFKELNEVIIKENVGKIILGIPYNLKGEETRKTIEVKEFYNRLQDNINLPVVLFNETYSTVDARDIIRSKRLSLKAEKKELDQVAACVILKNYLEDRG